MISELRKRIVENGHATLITVKEFDALQEEWITRCVDDGMKERIIHDAIEYFGCFLIDNHESLFGGGEDEIRKICADGFGVAKKFMIEAP